MAGDPVSVSADAIATMRAVTLGLRLLEIVACLVALHRLIRDKSRVLIILVVVALVSDLAKIRLHDSDAEVARQIMNWRWLLQIFN